MHADSTDWQADDYGHYDIQYNNPKAPTPHLYELAKDGIILQRHYVYQYVYPDW